jgi:aminoglycoside 3-N-acetyltransferase I
MDGSVSLEGGGRVSAPTRYQIRALGPDDVDLLRELLNCFGEVFDNPADYCAAQPDDAYLRSLLAGECFVAIIALAAGRVVGGLAGYELRKFEKQRSELYIYDLGVREPYRRLGIATALIEESKQVARERRAWVVFLQADLTDSVAIALYSKLGAREDVVQFDIVLD